MQKGVNPLSGGLSKASLEALPQEVRAKYQDNGLLLDGSIDNSPLGIQDDSKNKEETAKSDKIEISIEDLSALIDKKVEEKLASQPKIQAKTTVEKNESIDEIPGFEDWEFKDREYILMDGTKPVSRGIRHKHKKLSPLQYTNPVTFEVHSMVYASNQPSIFSDKQKGEVLPSHILMKGGVLRVPKENTKLQKFLAIHPDRNVVFKELDKAADAKKAFENEELVFTAQKLVREIGSADQNAIARLMCRDFAEDWDSFTMKNRLFTEAKNNPKELIRLANDKTLLTKGIIKTAMHQGYISYGNYKFVDTATGDVLLQVAPDTDEIEEMARYCLSNKGDSFYQFLSQKVK